MLFRLSRTSFSSCRLDRTDADWERAPQRKTTSALNRSSSEAAFIDNWCHFQFRFIAGKEKKTFSAITNRFRHTQQDTMLPVSANSLYLASREWLYKGFLFSPPLRVPCGSKMSPPKVTVLVITCRSKATFLALSRVSHTSVEPKTYSMALRRSAS